MTDEEYFIEQFHRDYLTKREIESEIHRAKFNTSFAKLLQSHHIKPTGKFHGSEEFYVSTHPSWIKIGFPISRLEVAGYGANYKMPLRMEKWFIKYLRSILKWNNNEILLWWNSTDARHFTDEFLGDWHRFKTESDLTNFLAKQKKLLEDSLLRLRTISPSYNKQSAENYYKGMASPRALFIISDIFLNRLLITDAATVAFWAKYKQDFIEHMFKPGGTVLLR